MTTPRLWVRTHVSSRPSKSLVTQPGAQAWCPTCSTLCLKPLHILSTTRCLISVHALGVRAAAVLAAAQTHALLPRSMQGI